ncbi:Lincomycin resistance protein LmrB [Talaromyces islandicus]|uniref:Lincomycin resistance protein LmrB n=1 Tax=Talaromyces islandicus TaxID=28573 RepID=A0A0U1M6P9_TALIS|nr:Lincomycin resistance protein LmrB [Talaromyces islandicus]
MLNSPTQNAYSNTEQNLSSIYHSNFSHNGTWPITVYFLATIPIQRLSVEATEVFGRRNALVTGIAIFSIGITLLSASHASFPMLLVGRGIQGVGAGVMTSVVPAILTEMVPPQRRSRYNCVILFCAAIGVGIGPAVGGVSLQDPANWRWIYYISAPFCVCLLILTPLTVRPVGETLISKSAVLDFDWTGIGLFSASLVVLILGTTWAGIPNRVADWRTLLTLGAGVVGLIGAIMYERQGASKPLISLQILKVSPFTFVCIFIHSVVMFTELFYIPEYARGVYELSPSYLGALLVALTVPSLLGTAVVGVVSARFRAYRWAIWSGWALTTASAGCMTVLDLDTSLVVCVILMVVAGLGHGLTMSGSHTAIQRLANTSHERDAVLLANFIRTIGICIAISAGGAAFKTRLQTHLFQSDLPKLLGNLGFNEAFWNAPKIAISHELAEAQREIFVLTFREIMYAITVLAGLGGLSSLQLVQRSNS